jgi:radical SAM protein with 4Fe4S-binding SPASM domain
MSSDFFLLNRNVMLEKGGETYAIYNLSTGDIIAIKSQTGKILELAERGKTTEEISAQIQLNKEDVINVLSDYSKKQLGSFYQKRIYYEKLKIGVPYNTRSFAIPLFQKCYIEFPGVCTINCRQCENLILYPCATCSNIRSEVDIHIVKRFIDRIIRTDCKNLIFYGGDPISSFNDLIVSIKDCREQGYQGIISIITNGSQLNEHICRLLERYQVRLQIPIFLTADIFWTQIIARLSMVKNSYRIPLSITVVYIKNNLYDMHEITEKLSKIKPDNIQFAVICHDQNPWNHRSVELLHAIQRVYAYTYYHMKYHHPCLWGSLAVSTTGDITPCPYLHTETLGNVNNSYWLEQIFANDRIYDYWDLSLSKIDNCKDCAFRFGCTDCRALEKKISGDLYTKTICSLPEKGNFRTQLS